MLLSSTVSTLVGFKSMKDEIRRREISSVGLDGSLAEGLYCRKHDKCYNKFRNCCGQSWAVHFFSTQLSAFHSKYLIKMPCQVEAL